MKSSTTVALALALSFAAACGGSSADVQAPRNMAFKDMTAPQRVAFMKQVVLPEAKALFAEFDASLEPVTCETCHGDGVADGSFELPNPKIKQLPGTPEAFMAWIGQDADAAHWTEFMHGKLEPKMAELLHRTPFDPATGAGDFSCGACHTTAAP